MTATAHKSSLEILDGQEGISEPFEEEVLECLQYTMVPESHYQGSAEGHDLIGHDAHYIVEISTESVEWIWTYFFPVGSLSGLRLPSLKCAKNNSTGLAS